MHRNLYWLAERLGMTVGAMSETMTWMELRGWMAHDRLSAIQSRIASGLGVSVSDLLKQTDADTMIHLIDVERSNGKT